MPIFRRNDGSDCAAWTPRYGVAARNAVTVFAVAAFGPFVPTAAAAPCVFDTLTLPGTTVSTCSGLFSTLLPDEIAISALVAGLDGVIGDGLMGSALRVDAAVNILTQGAGSHGLFAHSLGGAGGLLGGDGAAGSLVEVEATGEITTEGDHAHGVYAVSEGGIGGQVLSILGGSNGGDGGIVDIDALASIDTFGVGAHGVLALSIGGLGFEAVDSSFSGNGGNGGAVEIRAGQSIETRRNGAHAIDANSVGGAGSTLINAIASGNGGAGGSVRVRSSGTITTHGDEAIGIRARSIGGNGGDSLSISLPSDGANGGSGGQVTVESSGDISTFGAAAHGILASSEGGIGGDLNLGTGGNGGNGGAVAVSSSGNITANGTGASGIVARSIGGAKGAIGDAGVGANVTVNVTAGRVRGGAGTGVGINIEAGADAQLTNAGVISALSGRAIAASGVDVTIENTGTIVGDVSINASGLGILRNLAGGIFEGDGFSGGTLVNAGVLSPGGVGVVRTMAIDGDFEQTASGMLRVDADWTGGPNGEGTADKLTISGAANLAGTVVVNAINFPAGTGGVQGGLTRQFRIVEALAGVTNNGLSVLNTAAVDFVLLYPDSTTVDLRATIDFLGVGPDPDPNPNPGPNPNPNPGPDTARGITPNQTAVGGNLNAIFSSGSTLAFFGPLLALETQSELASALDQLAPVGDGGSFATTLSSGSAFAQQLLSCRVAGENGDSSSYIREGQCVWARGNVRHTDNDGGANRVGFQETATFLSVGGQVDVGGPWRVGAGFGFEESDLKTGSNARSEGERIHVGAALKYNSGPWLLAASVSGGHGWADNNRYVQFGGFTSNAASETESDFLNGRITVAHVAEFGRVYLKPSVDIDVTHLKRDAYAERGSGGIALAVAGNSDTVFSLSPSLEIGAAYMMPGGTTIRPYIKGGVSVLDTNSFVTTASFAEAPAGIAPFEITTEVDDVVADVGGGLDMIDAMGRVLRLQYDGRFGDETRQHSGSAKLSLPF